MYNTFFPHLFLLYKFTQTNSPITILSSIQVVYCLSEGLTSWSFVKELCIQSPMSLTRKRYSNLADLLKSVSRNTPLCRSAQICHCRFTKICWQKYSPLLCRFAQICHCRFTKICWQKYAPLPLQICSNLPAEIPPHLANLLKSASRNNLPFFADLLKFATADLSKSADKGIYTKDLLPARVTILLVFILSEGPKNPEHVWYWVVL